MRSGVLTQVAAAGGAVSAALEPVHHVLQMSTVAAALTPHEQSLHHMVTHRTYTGTLVAPEGKTHAACQSSFHVGIKWIYSGGAARQPGDSRKLLVPTKECILHSLTSSLSENECILKSCATFYLHEGLVIQHLKAVDLTVTVNSTLPKNPVEDNYLFFWTGGG